MYKAFLIKYAEIGVKERTDIYLKMRWQTRLNMP